MAKVLFFPAGVGLAHVGRTIEVAHALQKENIDIIFGAGCDAPAILEKEKLPYEIIPEFDRSTYDNKIKQNNWSIYTIRLINKFVKKEVELVRSYKPDLIVNDVRLTAKITSILTGIPLVSITNVDASKYYDYSKIRMPYKTYLGKFLPPRVLSFFEKEKGQKVLRKVSFKFLQTLFLRELFKFNIILGRYGRRPFIDPFDLLTGDLTILTDIPQFRPIRKLPESFKLVGPIFWKGVKKLPKWSTEIDSKKKIIYVTASGTGDKDLFINILKYLKDTSYTVIATCGNTLSQKEVKIKNPRLFLTDYLPGEWIMKRADLVIFPGGNATAYQALSFGVPQIGTPLHLDQEDNMNQLVRLETGIMLNPRKDFNRKVLINSVEHIMRNKSYRDNALKISREMKKYHGAKQAAKEIINFLRIRSSR
ncbi:hypothetical protein HY029_04230 [Candidatus Gottesmanbacteria bacterium]|nr:hypothetical protein [Candidatus Gottesmanbacteria bacterium]